MTVQRLRVAAYAVCIRDERVLLTHFASPDGTDRYWSLPGGGIEHAEDPIDAVVREVSEESGYQVEVDRLLGVDSRTRRVNWGAPGGTELHSVGVFYCVRLTGGELRHEIDGSSDQAAWFSLTEVPHLQRASLVDVGLELERTRPADGHVQPVPVSGLLRC
ncbi:NUDIX domain-containing protein [Streptomyces sp. NPDC058240]|uniref:NUDIX domain-containing protein n=1 Tax=Streptomyces sp. NPDC058240 TaxID=3346396 RepID=UPI0036E88F5D